jgi:hypothetical protein
VTKGSKSNLFRVGIIAAVFCGLLLLGQLALRIYLSEKRIREGISRATGMKVQFESCAVGVWGTVRLNGLTGSVGNGDSVSAGTVMVRPKLWAVLCGGIVLEEVRIRDVRLVRMEKAAHGKGGDQATELDSEKNGGWRRAGSGEVRRILGMVERVSVSNAAFDWLKADGSVRAQVEGADFWYGQTGTREGRGEVNFARAIWEESLAVDSVRAALRLREGDVRISNIAARCGGGSLEGEAAVTFGEAARFEFRLAAEKVDLGKMSQELPSLRISGIADARLQMEGVPGEEQTWTGAGEVSVADGMFKGIGVLQMLGQIFQVQELAQLKARRAHSRIQIAERRVTLDGLEVDAGDIQLTAPGVVDFRRSLSLNARITLPEQMIRGKALQLLDTRFSAADAAGRRSMDFLVNGTLDKPQTDLLEKLVGDNLGAVVGGALGGVVDQFLGGLFKSRKPAKPELKEEKAGDPVAKPQ